MLLCEVGPGGGGGRWTFGLHPEGRGVAVVPFVEVDVEKAEDEAEHGWAEAVAEAAHSRDHSLDQALLVGVSMHGHESADGWIGDAEMESGQN